MKLILREQKRGKELMTNQTDTCRLDGRQDMVVNTFHTIIDRITSEIGKKSKTYRDLNEVSGVLYQLFNLEIDGIRKKLPFWFRNILLTLTQILKKNLFISRGSLLKLLMNK